jgi:hypothetical protein
MGTESKQKVLSVVNGIEFYEKLSNLESYLDRSGMNPLGKFKFKKKVQKLYRKTEKKLNETIERGECYYGPFKGEFGHFLGHNLPFLMYLHSKGVKIHYCGLSLHLPFLVDESGQSILTSVHELRDFFGEVSPSSNNTVPPEDVQERIDAFSKKAEASGLPFWNIGDSFYYWFVHRPFVADGHTHQYDIAKHYKNREGNNCAIFARSKGAKSSKNNGESWDYQKVLNILSQHFDTVFVCGHPSQSLELDPTPNTELVVTTDNAKIIQAVANSNVIISQHSGVFYLTGLLRKKFLLLYKGGKSPSDVGSLQNSLHFLNSLTNDFQADYCFGLDELPDSIKKYA